MNTYIIEKATVLFVAHSFTLLTDEGSCRQKRTIYTIKSIIDNKHDKYYVIIYKLYVLELECTLFSLMLFFLVNSEPKLKSTRCDSTCNCVIV